MEYDIKYTCTACLKRTDDGISVHNNIEQNTQITYLQILNNITNNYSSNDMSLDYYPNQLCVSCIQILETTWTFLEIYKTSQNVLQQYYMNHNIKEEIKQEDNYSDAVSVNSEIYENDDNIKREQVMEIKTEVMKPKKKTFVGKRKIDKKKNADVKSYCPVCEGIFDTELKLRKHMKCDHPGSTAEIVYNCKICDKYFKRKTDLVVHRRIHSGERPFKCSICFRGFSQSGTLIEHSRLHTGETPFICKICKKVFSSRSSFWRHRLVHSKEKLFACEICGKTFGHSETLKHHKSVHSEDRPFTCDICNKSMKSKYALRQHTLIHAGRHFICEHCGKKFSMKHNVELHIKKMHSENAGECKVCSKVTSNLSEHMLIHNGHKPYKCKICDREFRQKNSLSFHLTMHKNAEKYKCKVEGCKKAFPKENMLTFHVNKIHSNETPHVCTKCSKGFYRNSDLSRHYNIAHLDCIV